MADDQNQEREHLKALITSASAQPITVKEAVARAMQYVREVYDNPFPDLMLEEVDKTDDRDYWLITLSFSQPDPGPFGPFRALTGVGPGSRLYKVIKVDADTGEVVSMKIRELEHAA